jgi:colicin import membrane protein
MNPSSANGVPYTIPPEPNRMPSMLIALLVHAGLLGFLWIGIRWQNVAPVSVEAEVWDMKTQSAAPPPAPRPIPVRPPEPAPPPKVAPPPPKVAEPEAPKPPDIALEREKQKKKLLEKKLAEEKVAKEKARELAENEAKEKELAEKKLKELADKKAADKARQDKLAKAAKDLADEKQLQKLRDLEMKRITSGAGTNGSAERSTAPNIDSGYGPAISRKIKDNSKYAGDKDVPGNPRVTFKIEQLPTGEIISVRKTKSSGIPAFDDAVERAINNSSPLPKKKDGTVDRSIDVGFKLKEFSDAD